MYELSNEERKYFGLEPIKEDWDRVILSGDKYRPESILYFDKNIIKRHIKSTETSYSECHYDESTNERKTLLPKTDKGKEKKLTASVLEQRQPVGVYLDIVNGYLTIGNYKTQTTFYSSRWDKEQDTNKTIPEFIAEFIEQSNENHFNEIEQFKFLNRQNIKFESGDYFSFKIDRNNFGFGRVLLDVNKIRKENLIEKNHGLNLLMGPPVIVQLFSFNSTTKNISIELLDKQSKLPSDVMMDNLLFYGEYEIIGHKDIKDEEFDFPISYGRSIDRRPVVFLQWGLIHKELPLEKFNKYIYGEKQFDNNPHGYYSIGFRPSYNSIEIINTIKNKGIFDFETSKFYKAKRDLRNPKNEKIKFEIFKVFGLDPKKNYFENSLLNKTPLPSEINSKLKTI